MPATDPAPRASTDRSAGITRVVAPAVAAAGAVLEGVTVTPAGRRSVVRVVVDLPDDAEGSLDLDQVAEVTRAVSAALDGPEGDQVLGAAPFVLEVSSPGVDRPLTQRRHWARARGRVVAVEPVAAPGEPARAPVTGRVERVGDEGVLLGGVLLAWAELEGARGRVQVEFSRPDQPEEPADDIDPDDTGDTDEED